MLIAYIDEVGEAGAFISKDHRRFNISPVFGLPASSFPNSMFMPSHAMLRLQSSGSIHSCVAQTRKNTTSTPRRGNAREPIY